MSWGVFVARSPWHANGPCVHSTGRQRQAVGWTQGGLGGQKKLEAFGAGLRSIGTKMAGIGVAAITALLGTAKVFSDSGDALDKMSARTGV
ncbi:MAG: hypothetical protein K2W85_17345, partial [Phycisphaerales bacterium]|nr:hypothetical protein [Phycisphaerales bacterium]